MNERELDVLSILWRVNKPMTATDIVNAKRGLTQSTVTAILRILLNENIVEVTGVTHSGKVLSRLYQPTEKAKEKVLEHFVAQYQSINNVIPASELCMEIISKTDKTKIKELKTILNELMTEL